MMFSILLNQKWSFLQWITFDLYLFFSFMFIYMVFNHFSPIYLSIYHISIDCILNFSSLYLLKLSSYSPLETTLILLDLIVPKVLWVNLFNVALHINDLTPYKSKEHPFPLGSLWCHIYQWKQPLIILVKKLFYHFLVVYNYYLSNLQSSSRTYHFYGIWNYVI